MTTPSVWNFSALRSPGAPVKGLPRQITSTSTKPAARMIEREPVEGLEVPAGDLAPGGAVAIEDEAAEDPGQPGPHAALVAERGKRLQRPDVRFLHEILGVFRRAGQLHRQAVEVTEVGQRQRVERLAVHLVPRRGAQAACPAVYHAVAVLAFISFIQERRCSPS